MNCEWCGEETDGKNVIVNEFGEFTLCPTCMNLYANGEFDKLNERIRPEIRELSKVIFNEM